MGSWPSNLVDDPNNDEPDSEHYHHPSEDEVLSVHRSLMSFVPAELADLIIDYAQYWPRLVSSKESNPPSKIIASSGVAHDALQTYIITNPPIPVDSHQGLRRKVRKVVFRIWSHDQGWGGDSGLTGDYEGSWTWFEALIYRGEQNSFLAVPADDSDTTPPPKAWHLQSNIRAEKNEALHEVVWTDVEDSQVSWNETASGPGTGFVQSLRPGDRIAVVARARYPGWVNHVRRIEVEIFLLM